MLLDIALMSSIHVSQDLLWIHLVILFVLLELLVSLDLLFLLLCAIYISFS